MNELYNACTLCPRKCHINRNLTTGVCNNTSSIKVARSALHYFEEPSISGSNGSGTIFFSGCNLKCCYCQNKEISTNNFGINISIKRLSELMLELQSKKANNINLVTPTHFVPSIIEAIKSSLETEIQHFEEFFDLIDISGFEKFIELLSKVKNELDEGF